MFYLTQVASIYFNFLLARCDPSLVIDCGNYWCSFDGTNLKPLYHYREVSFTQRVRERFWAYVTKHSFARVSLSTKFSSSNLSLVPQWKTGIVTISLFRCFLISSFWRGRQKWRHCFYCSLLIAVSLLTGAFSRVNWLCVKRNVFKLKILYKVIVYFLTLH